MKNIVKSLRELKSSGKSQHYKNGIQTELFFIKQCLKQNKKLILYRQRLFGIELDSLFYCENTKHFIAYEIKKYQESISVKHRIQAKQIVRLKNLQFLLIHEGLENLFFRVILVGKVNYEFDLSDW